MGLSFGPKNTIGLVRTSAESATNAFVRYFVDPRCSVVVSTTTVEALKKSTHEQRHSEKFRRDIHLVAASSEWCVVWATDGKGTWDPDLVSSVAKASGLKAVHAFFDDDDPRGSQFEFAFYDGEDRLARKVAVLGGRKVSTLALGPALAGEPERIELEKHVEHRNASAALRELLVGTGLPDVWDENIYDGAAQVITIACTYLPAPIIRPPSRSRLKRNETPPDYLASYARTPTNGAVADLLLSGESVTEGLFGFWDVEVFGSKILVVEVPEGDFNPDVWPDDADGWPIVRVASPLRANDGVVVYDSRAVVASQSHGRARPKTIAPTVPLRCESCSAKTFRVGVGFESSEHRSSPQDTSWFGLAVECSKCRRAQLVWEHEPFS